MKLRDESWCYPHEQNVAVLQTILDLAKKKNLGTENLEAFISDMRNYPYVTFDEDGFVLTSDPNPYQLASLEKVISMIESDKQISLRLNDEYIATYDGGNTVYVGCQQIPVKVITQLVSLIKKYK